MRLRSKKCGELEGHWSKGNLTSQKQSDGNSCGAFVLLVGTNMYYFENNMLCIKLALKN